MSSSRQCKRAYLPVRWLVLLVLWLWGVTTPVLAITLGQEVVLSLLGDPVEVEIDVLQWDDLDLERVEIALASRSEYESFDLSWLPVLEQLRFNLVGPGTNGAVKVLISTREPVAEPYLELLLVMRWPGGSLLREYVLLFDLPQEPALGPGTATTAVAPQTTVVVPAVPEEPPAAEPPAVVVPEALPPATRVEPARAAVQADPATAVPEPRNQGAIVVDAAVAAPVPVPQAEVPATGRRVYQVREGDGLWSIAQQFVPAGVGENIYQMLLSLHDLNRAAFINGNISLLKANALLQIPDADDITAIDAASAEARFEQRWAEGTTRLQTALRGDPLPAFSDLYEGERVEAGPQAELENRAPGTETGRSAPAAAGLLLPATTPVVVPAPAGAETGDVLLEEPGAQGAAANTASATVNPHLERIAASTGELQVSLQNRSLQIASLEQQRMAIRQRMRDARQATARLSAALEQALTERAKQQAITARSTTAAGLAALVLLVALLAALGMLLKLALQLRRRNVATFDGHPALAVRTGPQVAAVAGRSVPFARQAGQHGDTGIIVEESGGPDMEDAELDQELLEILGPAIRDEPEAHDHERNGP